MSGDRDREHSPTNESARFAPPRHSTLRSVSCGSTSALQACS